MCATDAYTIAVIFGSRLVLNGPQCCLNANYNAVLFCWAGNLTPSSPCSVCFSVCVDDVCAREAHRLILSFFLSRSPPCFETGSLTELGMCQFGQTGWPVGPGIGLVSSPQRCDCRHTLPHLAFTWLLQIQTPCFLTEQQAVSSGSCLEHFP